MIKSVLAITGSDYAKYVGGTNKLIIAHQHLFAENDYRYVCIYPFRILDRHKENELKYWCVRVNGELDAVVSAKDIGDYLTANGYVVEEIHIHQILNISLRHIDFLLSFFKTERIRVFLHDYQFICKNYLMLKNDESFCGTEPPGPEKCRECRYGSQTLKHIEQIRQLFCRYQDRIEMIAPSKYVEGLYKKSFDSLRVITVPHQVPVGHYDRPVSRDEAIRVAFIGYANKTKGWEEFEEAIRDFSDEGIRYLHYGKGGESNHQVSHVTVDTSDDPNAMVDSLREGQVDFSVLWSIVPETYSYAYNECLMAGTYILANANSGNIAQSVLQDRSGSVLSGIDELREWITDRDKLREMKRTFRMNAPMSFVDNDWIIKNTGHAVENGSRARNKRYDRFILKQVYSIKWILKGK